MAEKTGRNDPCPCGSGKKYKQCCLKMPTGKKKFTATKITQQKPLDLMERTYGALAKSQEAQAQAQEAAGNNESKE